MTNRLHARGAARGRPGRVKRAVLRVVRGGCAAPSPARPGLFAAGGRPDALWRGPMTRARMFAPTPGSRVTRLDNGCDGLG